MTLYISIVRFKGNLEASGTGPNGAVLCPICCMLFTSTSMCSVHVNLILDQKMEQTVLNSKREIKWFIWLRGQAEGPLLGPRNGWRISSAHITS